jgi:condensin complex subunit 2
MKRVTKVRDLQKKLLHTTSVILFIYFLTYTAANGGAIPFNTQFFHDDYDDGTGFDDVFESEGDGGGAMPDVDAGEQDLLAATAGQARRVRPEFVNYAKRAKRVDVRKLKENIWKGLDIKIAGVKEPHGEDEDEPMVSVHPMSSDSTTQFICVGNGRHECY